jgi:glycine/betaine/sarcosine/D-proline reductase family selenoprotein B
MVCVRIVHYINQFFGGIGGEDKADFELRVEERPVGPGIGLQKELGERAQIVASLVCGDNYFNLHMDEVRRNIVGAIARYQPDVVIAGPAFNAGRYGFACGEVCKSVAEQLGIPAVTAMYPENPGVAIYKSAPNVWILPTSDLAASMARVLPKLASFAMKLAEGAPIGSADQEGYIPTGRRRLETATKAGADRAITMLLAKLNGQPFHTEIPVEKFEPIAVPAGLRELRTAKVAVITTSGMVPKGNPDEFKMFNATRWGKYSLPQTGALLPHDWEFIHGGYNTAFAQSNPNVVFPLDALREFAGNLYGELSPDFYSITGVGTSLTMAQHAGEEIAASMREQRVDAALLVAT